MTNIRQYLKQWNWRQWSLTICVVLYLIYIAISYLYLPGKLKEVVQTDVSQMLGREIRVQRFFFNPFTLSLTADQFSIADRPELPLVAWNKLFVNFDAWGSLFGWKIRFSMVQLESPHIAIERRKQDYNYSSILTRLSSDKSPPAAAKDQPKPALALQIDDIQIKNGAFSYDDISGTKAAHTSIDDITVELKDLYLATGDDKLNPINLRAVLPHGGQLKLAGNYRVDPLKVVVNVQANDIHLEALKDFIANEVPLQLNSGRLTLQADIDTQLDKTLQVLVQHGQLEVTDLALDDDTQAPPLLRGKQLQLQGIEMNLVQQNFHIDNIRIAGYSTDQWLDSEGRLRIQPLFNKRQIKQHQNNQPKSLQKNKSTTVTSIKAKKIEAQPWDISIAKVSVLNSLIGFTDNRDGLNASQRVNIKKATIRKVSLAQGSQAPIQLNAKLNDSGELIVDGNIVPTPFSLNLKYQLQGLALSPFNPYLEQLSWLHLQQGSLDVDGNVQHMKESEPLTLDLNADVKDLKAQDSRNGAGVLQWKSLHVGQLKLDLGHRRATINKVTLTAPNIALAVNANKEMNLATIMRPAASVDTQSETNNTENKNSASKVVSGNNKSTAGQPWQVAINQVRIVKGSAKFRDNSVKPTFKAGLYALDFKLDQLTSAGKKPASFRLTSKVDKYAPFSVKGTLSPLQYQPGFALTSQLNGLEMPVLSPYSGTYIGNNLKSGQLTLDLQYQVKKHKLTGKNNIVAKQLYLGDEVESKQAVHMPVALGLALLRDAHGVIDLNLGVSGDLNDPKFSVAGIVWTALKNIIVKAAASPFKLLASLVGSKEDLGAITFSAGESVLTVDSQQRLQQLAKALIQRPQLVVTVHGNANAAEDDVALQQHRLLEKIAGLRKIPVTQLQFLSLLDVKANVAALEKLNTALKLPNKRLRLQTLIKVDPNLQGDALTLQMYQKMLKDVTAKQIISQQDLLNLADQRALAIKQYLVESAKLDLNRVKLEQTQNENLKSLTCQLGVES